MKRISIYTLSIAFLAIGIVSCAKTTKGKMINEWKATSYESVEKSVGAAGDQYAHTISMTEKAITETTTHESPSITGTMETQTGEVNTHDFTINKDGTWSWTKDVTFIDGSSETNTKTVESGTWSFVGKTKGDDFKKNERVLFNILTLEASETKTVNQVITESDTGKVSYSAGQNTMIYTITESKKDKLEMESESKRVTTQDSQTNMNSFSCKITLEGK